MYAKKAVAKSSIENADQSDDRWTISSNNNRIIFSLEIGKNLRKVWRLDFMEIYWAIDGITTVILENQNKSQRIHLYRETALGYLLN